jgi:hypothetical protein
MNEAQRADQPRHAESAECGANPPGGLDVDEFLERVHQVLGQPRTRVGQ